MTDREVIISKELARFIGGFSKRDYDIAKHFYELVRKQEEPVSEDLEKAAVEYATDYLFSPSPVKDPVDHFKAGAQWQKEQGVTKEAIIGMATEEISINISQPTLDMLDLCAGDKVIIQIRRED